MAAERNLELREVGGGVCFLLVLPSFLPSSIKGSRVQTILASFLPFDSEETVRVFLNGRRNTKGNNSPESPRIGLRSWKKASKTRKYRGRFTILKKIP